jgi:ADP-ribose pyrophosphatase YjhB (NUDIX family)
LKSIRPVAQGIIRKGNLILVVEGCDEKYGHFYRAVGGGVEYGERSEEALVREFDEELKAEIKNLKLLGIIGNIFGTGQNKGHEIDFIYEAEFVDRTFYDKEYIAGEEGSEAFKAVWKPLSFFEQKESPPLYPDGVIQLMKGFST